MLAVVPAMTPVAMGLSGMPVYPAARPLWPDRRRAGGRGENVAHSRTRPARDALAIRPIGAALIAEIPERYLCYERLRARALPFPISSPPSGSPDSASRP